MTCAANGCFSDYASTTGVIGQLKRGQTLFVQATLSNGQSINIPLPLGDFAMAYDRPPFDSKVFAGLITKPIGLVLHSLSEAKLGQAEPRWRDIAHRGFSLAMMHFRMF